MNSFELGRRASPPGMVVNIHFDPTKVTPRVRKTVDQAIRQGVLLGSCQSQAKKLAKFLFNRHMLHPLVTQQWGRSLAFKPIPWQYHARIIELAEADTAVKRLDEAWKKQYHWYREGASLDRFSQALRAGVDTSFMYCHTTILKDTLDIIASVPNNKQDRIEAALAELHGTDKVAVLDNASITYTRKPRSKK